MVAEPGSLELHHYLAIGGAAVVLLAVLLYCFRAGGTQVPAIVASGIGCLAIGLALGILSMGAFGYHWEKQPANAEGQVQAPPGVRGGTGGMPAKPGGGGGSPGGAGFAAGGGGRGAARGPSSPRQLAGLVTKLEQLTGKPITVELTVEQRQAISEQIKGLKEMEELSDEEAKKRFDALLATLTPHRAVLESVGFRWPGGGGGGPPGEIPNPFREDNTAQSLATLQGRLKASEKKTP